MGRLALFRVNEIEIRRRAKLELAMGGLILSPPGRRSIELGLSGADITVGDAVLDGRFVSQMVVEVDSGRFALVSPPEEGSIAPRCAGLPAASSGGWVVDRAVLLVAIEWSRTRGVVTGRTMTELADFARLSTSSCAAQIGEHAAEMATAIAYCGYSPMRGGNSPDQLLAPFYVGARSSDRVAEALVSALVYCSASAS